jgi:hypothetical protein
VSNVNDFAGILKEYTSAHKDYAIGSKDYASAINAFGRIYLFMVVGLLINFQNNREKIAMAKNRRLSPNKLAEEKSYFMNLKNISGYNSLKPQYEVGAIQTVVDTLDSAFAEETQLLARLAQVRDVIAENCTSLVEKNDGSVIQVAAQFGEDSPEYQSLGRKRKSERGARRPRNVGTPDA